MSNALIQPRLPFVAMNNHYACIFDGGKKWRECVSGQAFDQGLFFKDAFIIDADCRKFPVLGAEKLGWCRHRYHLFGLVNLFKTRKKRSYRFRFLVGEPIQMNFEQVKKEAVDHMIRTGLYKGGGGGPTLYRQKRENLATAEEFFEKIGFGGRWPF